MKRRWWVPRGCRDDERASPNTGFLPAQRDNEYNLLRVYAGADAPDLVVEDWSTLRAQRLHVEGAEPPEIYSLSAQRSASSTARPHSGHRSLSR